MDARNLADFRLFGGAALQNPHLNAPIPPPREWDAASYDSLPLPQSGWGTRIISLLNLGGTETVLDAGCGTGRDADRLLDLLPHGRVIALDGSARMLEQARSKLARRLDRVTLIQADLRSPLPLVEKVDVVFSVAAFHWIPDHLGLFRNLFEVLRIGGQLAADCGGEGNIARVHTAVGQVLGVKAENSGVWNFSSPDQAARNLQAAGFVDVRTSLESDPLVLGPGPQLERYLETVVLGSHLEQIPTDERGEFIRAVAGLLPDERIDYQRLTIQARRP